MAHPHSFRGYWLVGATTLLAASCSASSSPPPTLTDADALRQAQAQIDSPGAPRLVVPSSLAPVKSWTLYFGSGVSYVGTDGSGAMVTAVVLGLDSARSVQAVSWVVSPGFDVDWSTLTRTMAADFSRPFTATQSHVAGSLHFLGFSSQPDPCTVCGNDAAAALTKLATDSNVNLDEAKAAGSGIIVFKDGRTAVAVLNAFRVLPPGPLDSCCTAQPVQCVTEPGMRGAVWVAQTHLVEWTNVQLLCQMQQ
jgi:hypothetical protein